MNEYILKSLNLSRENYLDLLLSIYPMEEESGRIITKTKKDTIKEFILTDNKISLILELMTLELFPIKDSYIAFLKRSSNPREVLNNNPNTVQRLGDRLITMGLDEIIEESSKPKETNRKIGPMFKKWIQGLSGDYNITTDIDAILQNTTGIIILNISDDAMKRFATQYLGYSSNKGLDFIAKKDSTYVVGETKFLTDFGGHQNAQLSDAMSIFNNTFNENVIPVAILDGVVWIERGKQYNTIMENNTKNIFSALLLTEFLESI